MTVSLVKFENVRKKYSDSGNEVLSGVTFSIRPNSFQFLTGPSGAGKTTILRLILRTLLPSSGVVELFGQNTAELSLDQTANLRSRLGMVFQDLQLINHISVYRNVVLPFLMAGLEDASFKREAIDLLKWVGLDDHIHALPSTLSQGQQQRAAIARAVIGRPQILIADEPTSNVDPALARRILSLLIQLNTLGTSVIVATHDTVLMDQYEARRLVLHDGKVHTYE